MRSKTYNNRREDSFVSEKQKLTEKQKNILKFIYQSIRSSHRPPTLREIGIFFGFSSTGTVRDHLKALVRKGYIRITANKSRAIELIKEALFSFPVLGKVQAGLPSLAVEDIEDILIWTAWCFPMRVFLP